MRNFITISSIANVTRFSAKATVMLRGNTATALNSWHPNDCAGTSDDRMLGRIADLPSSAGIAYGKPEHGYQPVSSEPLQLQQLQPSFCKFQRIS